VDNRRLFLAIILSLVVVVVWQWLVPVTPPRRPPMVPSTTGAAQPGQGGQPAGTAAAGARPAAPASGATSTQQGPGLAGSQPAAAAGPPISAEREQRVILESGSVRAVFTNRGAQMLSLTVPEPAQPKERVELVRERREGPYPYALLGRDLGALPIDNALFAVDREPDGHAAVFRYSGPAGSAEKRFRLDARGLLQVDVRLAGGGWQVMLGPGIRNPTPDEQSNRYMQQGGAVYKRDGEVTVLAAKGESEIKEVPATDLRYAGLEDSYFLAAAIPQSGLAKVLFEPVLVQPSASGSRFLPVPPKDQLTGEQKDLSRDYLALIQPAGDNLSLLCYWGGKSYDQLRQFGLEDAVQLGRFSFIVLPLLASLHWIHAHVVANYGWAIILLTVVIKILLLPLTHHSTMSMRKMQVLNPKMQAIRERYRPKLKDKQGRPNVEVQRKMNEEVMALYKSEGVNPAGGCLPLLLQMPILYAFYQLLSVSVELRHAPWILWIHDLSAPDPFRLLPVIMGATQFLQVYLAPQSGDPAQRRLFLLMPLFMMVFFLSAPSGLVLYWLTNNILTIAQQAVYNRLWKQEADGNGRGR
jgi:YidC/Oxa1 family membrane protein insertase